MADNDDEGLFSPPVSHRYALSGKVMLGAIVVLLFVVIIMICLHLYVRLCLLPSNRRPSRRRPRTRRSQFVFSVDQRNFATATGAGTGGVASRGLPVSVVKSLPVFVYSSKTHRDQMDCAVCLSEFEEKEMGRIIPKCNHSFHVGCIDMWFYSHDTCPLCRSTVEPEPGKESDNPDEAAVSLGDPERAEPGSSFGPRGGEEERGGLPPTEMSSLVELVVVPSDESMRVDGFQQIDEASGLDTSKSTTSFVKSLSFKKILSRDKRDAVSPSGNACDSHGGIGS